MKTLSFFLFLILFSTNLHSQSGWTIQNSGTTDALFDSHFFDMNTGIIVGGTASNTAVILRTTNGGVNWNSVNANTDVLLRGISFITSDLGYVVGGNFTNSVILRTTDSGLNWDSVQIPTTNALRAVLFPPTGSGNIGYAVGFNGTALNTSNGGLSWNLLNTGIGAPLILFAVHFSDAFTGTAVGGANQSDSAVIIRTTNGGANWIIQNPNTNFLLRGVWFLNSSTGFVVGNNGTILKTSDGGNNWNVFQSNISGLLLRDIYFANSLTGFIVGNGGKILKTTNGGNTWDSVPSGTTGDLQSVFFLNELFGTAVGFNGTIINTNTGGVITSINSSQEILPEQYYLSQNYPNPFNPVTNLEFGIPDLGFVSLKVYDVLGNEVKTLVNENKPAGNYTVTFDGSDLESGIYFYKINVNVTQSGSFTQVRKMVLIK